MLFIDSLLAALSPFTLAMNFVGVMLGMIVGALPGLGSVVAITICLPFTFGMTSVSAIALLLGVYCGSICGGSIAAVLINTPGTPQSAATAFDGYPMARAGKPGKAIGWALAASIFGGVFSCVILTFAAPQIAVFALQFGPLETCALILMGLTCISSVSANNQFKGLAMGVLGLLLACVGMSPFSAESRFTFDIFALNSGIDLVAVIVGVFALSEVLDRVERMRREARVENGTSCRVQLPSLGEWRGRMSGLVKSSLIGTFVGILPGTGAATAAFLSYGEARRSSPRRENIGKGEPDGIIAAESSNNAVTGGALVPSLALGIPGDPVTAIMLATLTIHGVTPGVRLMTENPEMALRMLAALSLRLRMFAHKLAAQGQGGAACRLATYLLHRRQIGGGDCIRLGVSREVLANLLGLARETLSRQLSRFSEAGLVELRGKDIVILDVPALQATAAEGDR